MGGLKERAIAAAQAIRRGHFILGGGQVEKLRAEMPVEIQMAYDIAIERSDFVRAADIVEHEWAK
jgi:hypothetical protein